MDYLKELIKNGFEIEKISEDCFLVIDNGMFGFKNSEDSFFIDFDELIEIYDMYIQ